MSLPIILLAAQAAGIAMDMYASKKAAKSQKQGFLMDQQNAETKISQLQLQSTEDAIFGLDQLRQNLSTQRAISGARGQSSGMGSAHGASMASQRAYNADERAREMSLRFKTFDVRQDVGASRIAMQAQRRQLSQGFMNRTFQSINTNQLQKLTEEETPKLNKPSGERL